MADEDVEVEGDYHVVTCDTVNGLTVRSGLDVDAVISAVRNLIGTPTRVQVYRGVRVSITRGPLRYLLLPDQSPVPLFDVPGQDQVDDTGDLSDEYDAFEPARRKTRTVPLDDDDDDDGGGEDVMTGSSGASTRWGDREDD